MPVQLMSVGGQWQVRFTHLTYEMLRRLRLHLQACCTAVLCTPLPDAVQPLIAQRFAQNAVLVTWSDAAYSFAEGRQQHRDHSQILVLQEEPGN